jgi:hypothetical protein
MIPVMVTRLLLAIFAIGMVEKNSKTRIQGLLLEDVPVYQRDRNASERESFLIQDEPGRRDRFS